MTDHATVREAYRRGVRDTLECLIPYLRPPQERAINSWLTDLDNWTAGDPPAPPHRWPVSDEG